MIPSPERSKENTPREMPNSAVSGLRNMLSVLASAKEDATLARKPTPTMYQP
jgi:hypothetical protein